MIGGEALQAISFAAVDLYLHKMTIQANAITIEFGKRVWSIFWSGFFTHFVFRYILITSNSDTNLCLSVCLSFGVCIFSEMETTGISGSDLMMKVPQFRP
jgi:hypothetical protein